VEHQHPVTGHEVMREHRRGIGRPTCARAFAAVGQPQSLGTFGVHVLRRVAHLLVVHVLVVHRRTGVVFRLFLLRRGRIVLLSVVVFGLRECSGW
jgi:hypothetical protein